jgi:hypothetical protein
MMDEETGMATELAEALGFIIWALGWKVYRAEHLRILMFRFLTFQNL